MESASQTQPPLHEGGLLQRVIRQPLLHFVLLGALLFAVDVWQRDEQETTIRVSRALRTDLLRELEQRYGREPSPEELDAAMQRWRREEVLFREALNQGLDRNDPTLRTHLVSKLLDLKKSLIVLPTPTPEQLDAWLEKHRADYEIPERYDFEHAFASNSRPEARQRAERMLQEIEAGTSPRELGDPFEAGRVLAAHTPERIAKVFGASFARAIPDLVPGRATLLESDHGFHAVLLRLAEGGLPPRELVLPRLTHEFQRAALNNALDEYAEELERGYHFTEEP